MLGRRQQAGPPERIRILAVGGRTLRVSVREGTRGWPPLLLCNGIGASLELHVYHGGHLELAADSGRLAAAVETFLNADLTAEGASNDAGR
jgi:hypothetical protein